MLEAALYYVENNSCLTSAWFSCDNKALGARSGIAAALSGSTTADGLAVKNPSERTLNNSIRQPIRDQQ